MGNKRQRQAQKRFKGLNPGTAEKSTEESSQGSEGVQKHGEKRMRAEHSTATTKLHSNGEAKRRKQESTHPAEPGFSPENTGDAEPAEGNIGGAKVAVDENGGKQEKLVVKRRHPLRVPGKRPGEGCFRCDSRDHIAKDCPQKVAQDRKKICLHCRQWGHTLKNCPTELSQEIKCCYNCGEKGHRLAECKQPLRDGGTSFAECFLCKQTGHLSKDCPSNPHGIYPKGGSCKVCGGVTHLAKDCPNKEKAKSVSGRTKLKIATNGALLSDGGKRTVFRSGDDLEDDFVDGGHGEDAIGNLDFGSDQDSDVRRAREAESRPSKSSKTPSELSRPALHRSRSSNNGKVVKF